ncbi:MAG: hypothetical protein PHN82_10380 [bacterium]|nr:hypothetical protein [bacterium]
MKRMLLRAGAVACAACVAAPAMAQAPLSPGQERLMAKRAAQVDAYRKLTEEIKGLRIDSNTFVRDFVAESDQINTALNEFIKGLKVDGPPRHMPDGTCEVDVKVTLQQIMQCLKRINLEYPDRKRTTMSFDQMGQYTKKTVFSATGVGLPPGMKSESTAPKGADLRTAGIPGWEGVTPQGRLLAERGALTDARRNLAETVHGLRITGNTYVRDFAVVSDQVQTSLGTFINGVKEAGPYRYLPDGVCEVDVEVTLQDVIKQLNTIRQQYYAGWPPTLIFREIQFERIIDWGPPRVIRATGNGAVPARGYLKGAAAPAAGGGAPSAPPWSSQVATATGTGVPREGEAGAVARLNAERAAEAVARRNLAEKVYGVRIDASTTVRDFVTVDDQVKAAVERYLAGARVAGEPVVMPDGTVEVTMELPLDGVWRIMADDRIARVD